MGEGIKLKSVNCSIYVTVGVYDCEKKMVFDICTIIILSGSKFVVMLEMCAIIVPKVLNSTKFDIGWRTIFETVRCYIAITLGV